RGRGERRRRPEGARDETALTAVTPRRVARLTGGGTMDRTTDQATIVESSGAFDATLEPERLDSAVIATAPSSATTTGRTTVLPRVERHDEATMFVQTARPRFAIQRPLGEGGIGQVVA